VYLPQTEILMVYIDEGGIVHLMSTASAALIEALFFLIAAKVKKMNMSFKPTML